MKGVMDSWVAVEDNNEFCKDTARDEIDSLLQIEALSGLKDVEDEEADDDTDYVVKTKKPITSETLHELTLKLKSLAVEIGEFEGDDFGSVASDVFDTAERLRTAFRKVENTKKASKWDNNRQTSMFAFMKK